MARRGGGLFLVDEWVTSRGNRGIMTFGALKILWLLALLIPLVWIMRLAWGLASRRMKAFGKVGLAPRAAVRVRIRCERLATVIAVAGILVALAGPRGGFDEVEIQSSGSDIFVALDLSNSMLASDVRPSRFDRARREVFDLLDHVAASGRADRVGLIGFAGVSFVQCPLTSDAAALREYLMLMSPENMPVQGTDIGAAITTALAAMDAGGVGPDVAATRAIILISDGENLAGEADAAVKEAKSRGVKIFTVGVGTAEGSALPDLRSGGLKKDRRGNVIVSRFSGKSLRMISEETGGEYVELGSGGRIQNLDFVAVLGEKVHESGKVKLWHEKFQWPLGVAAIAVGIAMSFGAFGAFGGISGLILAAALLAPGERAFAAGGSGSERDRLKTYNEGVDAHEGGDFARARELFKKAARDDDDGDDDARDDAARGDAARGDAARGDAAQGDHDDVAARSHYNEGNAAVGAGDLDGAEKSYDKALKLAPDDKDTMENLAWVKEMKKAKQEKQQEQQQQNQEQNQEQKQKQEQENKQASQKQEQENKQASQKPGDSKSPANSDQQKQAEPKPGEKRELSREEAERMLNSVDDVKAKYLYFVLPKDQQEKAATPPEKDW